MALERAAAMGEVRISSRRGALGSLSISRIRAIFLVFFLLAPAGCLSRSLTGMQILPAAGTVTISAGQTSQFQAQAVYTESGHATTSNDVTGQVTWQSSSTAVATISQTGLATGVSAGTATITGSVTGTFGLVTATSNITVTAAASGPLPRTLTSLAVTPSSQTVATAGQTSQFIAIGTYSSGSPATQNLTNSVSWQTSNGQVATVNSFGLVTTTGAGQATITALATASDGSVVSASGMITVTSAAPPRVLTSLLVTPSSQTVASAGETSQFIAVATYSSGTPLTQNLTSSATWESSDASVATVNSSGLVTSVGAGEATISALATSPDGSVTSSNGTITVNSASVPRSLTSLLVIPNSQVVATAGQTSQFIAVGTYSSGSPTTENLTGSVSWQTSEASIATVNSAGLVTTVGAGVATISALATSPDGSVASASATITVTSAPLARILASLVVIPTVQLISTIGETVQFIAIGTYNGGVPVTQDLTGQVLWRSSDPDVALVNSFGLATVTGVGNATITAIATSSDGSATSASGLIQPATAGQTPTLPTLTIYKVGSGTGTVTGTIVNGDNVTVQVITCGSGTGCTGSFSLNEVVTLTAAPGQGSQFDGWSVPCSPANASTCTITMTSNETVGAIFDPTAP